jgi:glycosyltransferase involved in cell wall biosynthesis
VVTTPVGGIPQVVRDGENGLLVEPGDVTALGAALERLLSQADLRRTLGTAARSTIEDRYSLDATMQQLAGIYRRFGVTPRGTA